MSNFAQSAERTRDYFRNPDKYKKRNHEIMQRVADGELQSEIARDFGLTRQRVHSIIKRERARRENG